MSRGDVQVGWMYRKLLRHPLLEAFLDSQELDGRDLRVGWGCRPSGMAAHRAAKQNGERLLIMEDALVRSIRPGCSKGIYGVLADSVGVHYDASGTSDLIHALNSGQAEGWMRKELFAGECARDVMARFRDVGVSKYNWFAAEFGGSIIPRKSGTLVVDQTRGDMAIRHGGLGADDFERMLMAAFDECQGAPVYLRAHPDHLYRSKHTCFSKKLLKDSRLRLLPPDLSPAQCFSFVDTVMVASSLMGMEALIHGKHVVTFGQPFFAGWGLTDDRSAHALDHRQATHTLESLFEMAYMRYCHYFDPDTHEPCPLGNVLDHIELQKQMYHANRGLKVAIQLSPWKKRIAEHYLRSPSGVLVHAVDAKRGEALAAEESARVMLWGRRPEVSAEARSKVVRIEDGFIRSKGLGAAFNFPYSWVVDQTGIYYDAGSGSDLEDILNSGFTRAEISQADILLDFLRRNRLTKYNLSTSKISLDVNVVAGRKVILVPGQVEADASIEFGSPELKANLDLIKAVRVAEPDAFIVYKVHPDLVAGTRHGDVLSAAHEAVCDQVAMDGNMADWLDACDEVHTMTSTTGFEALVRGVPVVTYGLPFYAGWGLTEDRLSCHRRKRQLTLEELVCGALIKYPRYLNPDTGEFTTAIKVAEMLISDSVAADRRVWYLKWVSKLKKLWVSCLR